MQPALKSIETAPLTVVRNVNFNKFHILQDPWIEHGSITENSREMRFKKKMDINEILYKLVSAKKDELVSHFKVDFKVSVSSIYNRFYSE